MKDIFKKIGLLVLICILGLCILTGCDKDGGEISQTLETTTAAQTTSSMVPQEKSPSFGLEYELSDDGAYYTVVGIGSCTQNDVIIPDQYNGKPVISISDRAFYGCDGSSSVTLPNGVPNIGGQTFFLDTKLVNITIPNGIKNIGNYAFGDCSELVGIKIPSSVMNIGSYAFKGCTKLTSIYYQGNSTQWTELLSASNDFNISTATVYYYNETQPTVPGNYWHFVDGSPVVW